MEKKRCPICGQWYETAPALSRTDNKTDICPDCGTRQALEAAGIAPEQQDEIIIDAMHRPQFVQGKGPISYRILETHETDYPHNVQQIKEYRGQQIYSGFGRFCKTLQEARAYIKEQEAGR